MFICVHINIFNASLTVWTVSSAHLTLWGELYQPSVMAQQRRQTQSHRLFKAVNQELHSDYHHLDNDQFSATVISYIRKYILSQFNLTSMIYSTLTSSNKWALLAQDDDLGAHGLSCLLDGQAAFFIHVDDGDSGVHTSSFCHRCDDSPGYYCHTHIKR